MMRKWLITFVGSSALSIAGVLLALWAINGFRGIGIGLVGTLALVGGIFFTVGLGVALMGLVFYSDRSDTDEQVAHTEIVKRPAR
jgi:hypothetical protein